MSEKCPQCESEERRLCGRYPKYGTGGICTHPWHIEKTQPDYAKKMYQVAAERDKYRDALIEIASQRTVKEIESHDGFMEDDLDLKTGYEALIGIARSALGKKVCPECGIRGWVHDPVDENHWTPCGEEGCPYSGRKDNGLIPLCDDCNGYGEIDGEPCPNPDCEDGDIPHLANPKPKICLSPPPPRKEKLMSKKDRTKNGPTPRQDKSRNSIISFDQKLELYRRVSGNRHANTIPKSWDYFLALGEKK